MGKVDVYCTHLSPVFVTIPYPRDSGSWATEQAEQIEALRGWIDQTKETDTVLLVGDFNTGPAEPGIDPEVPDDYATLSNGYANFYASADPECTFCADCAKTRLGGLCPNCSGELVARPVRPPAMLAKYPASTERVLKAHKGCAA
jgi:hypothetical protein